MERSRKRTPMIYRSKAVCAIALAVGFGCAVFGVGGATAGNGTYFRHVREARLERKLAGLALAHRSPEQLVLAITPEAKAHIEDTTAAVPPAATTPVATTTPATTTAPATTTTGTTTGPTDTTTSPDPGSESASESAATAPTTTTTGTTTTGTTTTGTTTTGTTTTGTTTTGTTTTGTTTTPTTTTKGTTTTGTTTTGTTTTGTTTTGTTTTGATTTGTTTTGTPDAGSLPIGHGRQAATTGSGSTTSSCHGRCDGLTGRSGVVPASLPSSTSSSNSSSLSIGSVTTPLLAAVPTASVNDSSAVNPISIPSSPPASTPTPPVSSPAPTPPSLSLVPGLENIISSSRSAIDKLTQSTGSHHSAATLPTAAGGTGTTAAGGATGTGPAGTAPTGGTAASGTANTTGHAQTHRSTKQQSSGGSPLPKPITQFVDRVVNHIPTAVWIALGGAFALALAFAGMALRSSRRARRREKEFAAISAAALTDALTGILNRRGFTEAAERELARASRYDRPFVLAYVDVRGLKTVNDTEGHLMGDELIKTVAGLMKESARADDVVGRIGGDEFALLLGEQTAESAGPVVRRIQAHVAEARAATEISVPWELTIGMASFPDDGATLEELLDVADRRLYEQRGIALR